LAKRPRSGRARLLFVLASVAVTGCLVAPVATVQATGYPPLSEPGRLFLENLSSPPVTPGASTSVTFVVANPESFAITSVVLTLGVYAFNGYPGDASGSVPVTGAPALANGTASGRVVNWTLASLAPGASARGSVGVTTSPSTPAGTFAIRTALAFHGNASVYRLESRGWFSLGLWENATRGPNGTSTVNLTMLNVSGVLPETAVLVEPAYWPIVLDALLGVGLLLVGVGAFVYFRRTASSRSGAG
jgi:hypothetical protein